MELFTTLLGLFIAILIIGVTVYFISYKGEYKKQKNPIKTEEVCDNKHMKKVMVFQVDCEKGRVYFTYITEGRPFGYVWNIPVDAFEKRFNFKLKQDGEE